MMTKLQQVVAELQNKISENYYMDIEETVYYTKISLHEVGKIQVFNWKAVDYDEIIEQVIVFDHECFESMVYGNTLSEALIKAGFMDLTITDDDLEF